MSTAVMDDVSRETTGLFEGEEPLFDAPTPGTKTDDPQAPYGFTTDGKPRAKPGRKPGLRKAPMKAAGKAIPAPQKKAAPRTPPAPKKTQVDYRPALLSLGGEFIGSAAIWGLMKDNMRILANTAAVATAYPDVVDGINTAADKWPIVAAILDRVLPMAEFAKSGGKVVWMFAQIAVNHQLMPPGLIPGTMPMDKLVASFLQQQAEMNPDFAATVAAVQQMRGMTVPTPA